MNSETYWFAGGEYELMAAGLPHHLAAVGIQPAWIEEIHWVAPAGVALPDLGTPAPVCWWPPESRLHRLLHFSLSDLQTGVLELVLLAEIYADQVNFALLGSPPAAGRRNLLPRFRLTAIPNAPGIPGLPRLLFWRGWLEKMLLDPLDLAWVTAPDVAEQDLSSVFPNSKNLQTSQEYRFLGRLHQFLAHLDQNSSQLGLLIDTTHPRTATLVERI